MNFSFFRQKLSGSFKENNPSNEDGSASRVFDPADLKMLKDRAPRAKKSATKSEFVNLFRSQLSSVHRQG